MADPIDYRIWRHLQTALQAIRAVNGYHNDLQADVALKLDPNHNVDDLVAPDGPRPFCILELGDESWVYHPASQIDVVMPFTIHFMTESDPQRDESRMQEFFKGCADIERAIAVDSSRGGLATDTRIVRRRFNTELDGTQVWAVVEGVVKVARTYGQPNG